MNTEHRNALGEGLVEDSYKTFGSCRATIEAGEPIIEAEILEDGDFYEPLAKDAPLVSPPTPSLNPATHNEDCALSSSICPDVTTPIYHDSSRCGGCKESQGLEEAGGGAWAWWRPPQVTDWLVITGGGERTGEDCGTFYKRLVCEECGDEKGTVKVSCYNRACSECWGDWVNRATRRICERLGGYRLAYNEWASGVKGRRRMGNPKHIILSPPPTVELRTWADAMKLRRKAEGYARKLGVWGGVIIFHAYRIRAELKPFLAKFKRPYWELVREDVLNLGSWEKYVYLSPHFHVLGFGRLQEKSNEFYERTGWIYKLKGHVVEKEWGRTVYYLLSHATAAEGRTSYGYFGNMVYLAAKVVKKEERELRCEKCGGRLLWEYYDGIRQPATAEIVVKVFRFRRLVVDVG